MRDLNSDQIKRIPVICKGLETFLQMNGRNRVLSLKKKKTDRVEGYDSTLQTPEIMSHRRPVLSCFKVQEME